MLENLLPSTIDIHQIYSTFLCLVAMAETYIVYRIIQTDMLKKQELANSLYGSDKGSLLEEESER